jgi:FliI/YscN family ATPase
MLDWPLTHAQSDGWTRRGTVCALSTRCVQVRLPGLTLGSCVVIESPGGKPCVTQAVEVHADGASCVPLGDADGIRTGARATSTLARMGAFAGAALLGKNTDAWGRCADGRCRGMAIASERPPLPTSQRSAIHRPLRTGVAAIDLFASIGYGQRIALFAGAGVGKTALLRRIVQRADVDARVVALVGERGREAAELMTRFARDPSRATTTVICATAEAPPTERLAAARTATAHAEALADGGRDVLLVVDSLTRVATAWREHALAAGEPPAHRGHPPSFPGALARLVERAGARATGSVTGVYAVLVEGDDPREPVTDAIRALLDGHVVLSRSLAESGRYPAVDVLRSLSRLMHDLATPAHLRDAVTVRAAMSALEQAEDLFAIGAYRPGGDRRLDAAVRARDAIDALVFDADGRAVEGDHLAGLAAIARRLRDEA